MRLLPTALVAAAVVGAVGSVALTAAAMVATAIGGYVIARRAQIRNNWLESAGRARRLERS